jgi:general stress protein 26
MQDISYYLKRANEIVRTIHYATLATVCEDGKPWNSPVAKMHDDELNIYWVSDKEGTHSRNVRRTQNTFIVIYDSTVPEGQGEGVYIQAKVYELNDRDQILELRQKKKNNPDLNDADKFLGDGIRRFYKAVPERVWMNDAEMNGDEFIRDIRVELPLDELKKLLKQA